MNAPIQPDDERAAALRALAHRVKRARRHADDAMNSATIDPAAALALDAIVAALEVIVGDALAPPADAPKPQPGSIEERLGEHAILFREVARRLEKDGALAYTPEALSVSFGAWAMNLDDMGRGVAELRQALARAIIGSN